MQQELVHVSDTTQTEQVFIRITLKNAAVCKYALACSRCFKFLFPPHKYFMTITKNNHYL